jgi:hypothetical protein
LPSREPLRVRRRRMRPKPAQRRILAEVPQRERAFFLVRRRRLAGQQMLRIVRIHRRQSPTPRLIADSTGGRESPAGRAQAFEDLERYATCLTTPVRPAAARP